MIRIIFVGRTNDEFKFLLKEYSKRIKKYSKLEIIETLDIKNTKNISILERKEKEGNLILKNLKKNSFLIILDEKGKKFSTKEFSKEIEKMQNSNSEIVFLVGGAYGFSNEIYNRANKEISLSKMTFTHQMVRVFFIEQIYRAFSILNNSPYHH